MNATSCRVGAVLGLATLLLCASGCANRQVIDSALKQAIDNNALLAKEQAKQTEALARATDSSRQLAASVKALVEADCRRLNAGRTSYAQARKDAVAYKLRVQFDDAAYDALEQFTVRFNETYSAPMRALTSRLNQELTDLRTPALANDLARNVQISDKMREMTGVALEAATQNVQMRDRLIGRLTEERARFAAAIDSQLAAVQMPTENCDETATTFETALSALGTQTDALRTYQASVEALYASQEQGLEAVRAYANRMTFYKLVLQGAKDAALDKVRDLSGNVQNAIVSAETRLDALLNKASSSVTTGIGKFEADLDNRAGSLSDILRSAIESSRSELGTMFSGSTRSVSNTTKP
jgi:hypothetical protein